MFSLSRLRRASCISGIDRCCSERRSIQSRAKYNLACLVVMTYFVAKLREFCGLGRKSDAETRVARLDSVLPSPSGFPYGSCFPALEWH